MDEITKRLVAMMVLLLLSVLFTGTSIFLPESTEHGPNSLLLILGILPLTVAAYIARQLFLEPEKIRENN